MRGIDLTRDRILHKVEHDDPLSLEQKNRGRITLGDIRWSLNNWISKGTHELPWYVPQEEKSFYIRDDFAWRYNPTGCDKCGAKLQPWDFWSLCTDCHRVEENFLKGVFDI